MAAIAAGLLVIGLVLEGRHLARAWSTVDEEMPICRVATEQDVVALTFDDGPDPAYTPDVLGLLEPEGLRATFFLTGANASSFPSLVRQERAAGMELGNHTWSHARLTDLSSERLEAEIERAVAVIPQPLSTSPRLFRAPYGIISPEQLEWVRRAGLTRAASAIVSDLRPGDILLAHDARVLRRDGGGDREKAMRTLRLVLDAMSARGLKATTVSELLDAGEPVRVKRHAWFWQSGFSCPAR